MPACEMCGKELPSLRRATVEGTVMSVCGNCVKFGVEIAGAKTEVTGRSMATKAIERRAVRGAPRDVYAEMQEELAADYSARVRKARERKGLTTAQLAERIKERELIVKHVEGGQLHPTDDVVKKLERELGIKLMEKPEAPTGGPAPKSGGGGGEKSLTLGDLIKKELEKGKK